MNMSPSYAYWGTIIFVLVGVGATTIFALLNHPHRAVYTLAGTLIVMAGARLVLPGRPWFASRNRWTDAMMLAFLALGIWYFSPFTATMNLLS